MVCSGLLHGLRRYLPHLNQDDIRSVSASIIGSPAGRIRRAFHPQFRFDRILNPAPASGLILPNFACVSLLKGGTFSPARSQISVATTPMPPPADYRDALPVHFPDATQPLNNISGFIRGQRRIARSVEKGIPGLFDRVTEAVCASAARAPFSVVPALRMITGFLPAFPDSGHKSRTVLHTSI